MWLVLNIYKEPIQLNNLEKTIKNGQNEIFFQRRHTNGKHTYEKVLNITNHQRNINQNHRMATKMVRNNKRW